MIVNGKNIDIDKIVENIDIDSNIPLKRTNGLVLRNIHIEILKKYNINYQEYGSLQSLIIVIEDILNESEDLEDLEWVADELSELNYYYNTNK